MKKVKFVSMKTWRMVRRWEGLVRAGKECLLWGETASGINRQKESIQKGNPHDVKGSDDESTSIALPDKDKVRNDDKDRRA